MTRGASDAQWGEAADFPDNYIEGDLIARAYKLPALREIAAGAGVTGVAQFMMLPSFEPEHIVTLTFRANDLRIHAVKGRTSLWYAAYAKAAGIDEDRFRFDPAEAAHAVAEVAYTAVPHPFDAWQNFITVAAMLGSCETNTLDGISFRHEIFREPTPIRLEWHNPDHREHGQQVAMIKSYGKLLREAGLGEFYVK